MVGLASLTLTDIALAEPCQRASSAAYNWTGFYAGGHAGYRWADLSFSGPGFGGGFFSSPPQNANHSVDGGIVGVQAGYNCMVTSNILAGIEGDWSWGRSKASAAGAAVDNAGDGFIFRSEAEMSWQATLRGRLGVVNGQWLIYGTGGVAFARSRWSNLTTEVRSVNPVGSWSSQLNTTLTGWVLGFGVEYMWKQNWIARLEYLHESFGDTSMPFGPFPLTAALDTKDVNKLRLGVSYKFRD